MATEKAATFNTATLDVGRNLRTDFARVWIALGVLGVGLFANQYVTLRKLKELLLNRAPGDPVATLGQKVWGLIADSWAAFVTPPDLLIAAAVVLPLAYLVYAEVTRGTVTDLLHEAQRSERTMLALLTLVTVVITRGYLNPGQVFMGDAETHMLRAWMFEEHFRNLDTPVWSNSWYGGFPLLANYGPLYFIVTALMSIGLGDVHVATKLLLWLSHVGSVFGMFLFLRTVIRQPLPAFVGAVAYALSFHRLHILLYQGDLQVAVVFLLIPFVLLVAERFIASRQSARRTFVVSATLLAVMILNHHGYAFFGLVFVALYLTARLAVTEGPVPDRFKVLVFFGATQVAALFVSAFLLVPFMFEMDEHRGMPNTALPILVPNLLGPIMLVKLFRWAAIGDGGSIGYIGLSIGILAVSGIMYGIRRREPAVVGLTVAAVASLLMVKDHVSYNVKNINFFMIFVSALSAWSLVALTQSSGHGPRVERSRARWRERFPAHAAALMLALLVVDLGPTTFQSVYRENYEFKQPMYQRVLAIGEPYKLIERQVLTFDPQQPPDRFFDPNKLGIPSAYAATQTPLGFFHEGAGRSFGYSAELVKRLHRDLNGGRLSEETVTGLYLMGVKYVIFRDRYQWFTPALPPSPYYAIEDGILRLTHATPLLFSTRVVNVQDIPGYPASDLMIEGRYLEAETFDYRDHYYRELVRPLVETMKVDMTRGVAGALVTRDDRARVDLGSPDTLRADILEFSTTLKRVTVRYQSNQEAFGRVPYTYFPHLRVEVDGQQVEFYRSGMDQILVRLPAGEHTVTVHGLMPPLQYQMSWLSAISFATVLLVPRRLFSTLER